MEKNPKDTRPVESLSWSDFVACASNDQLLKHLKSANLAGVDLSLISRFLKDPTFYAEALDALRNRNIFDDHLWSWSVYHADEAGLKEWLEGTKQVHGLLGPVDLPLLQILPRDKNYRHLEYYPLINARTHRIEGKASIQNDALKTQWEKFLGLAAWYE